MRLLLITDHWYPERNVPQRRWKWLGNILRESGHELYVATPNAGKGVVPRRASVEDGEDGETVIRTWGRKGGIGLSERALQQGLTALGSVYGINGQFRNGSLPKPDLVIGTVPGLPTAVVTFATARALKAPFALDIRDAWPDLLRYSSDWNRTLGKKSLRERMLALGPLQIILKVAESAMNFTYARSALMLTTSERFAERLKHSLIQRHRSTQTVVIRNVFPPVISLNELNRQQTKGLNQPTELRVIYAGKIGRAQNLGNAVRAVSIANSKGVPVVLRMIGSGVAVESLKELTSRLNARVEFLGHLEAEELKQHYTWADTALVHLASWPPLGETVPSKVFELINSRIHISGVIAGESADLLDKLSSGHTVEPDDPIALAELWKELWTHPQQLKVGPKGKQWIEREREEVVPRLLADALANFPIESEPPESS